MEEEVRRSGVPKVDIQLEVLLWRLAGALTHSKGVPLTTHAPSLIVVGAWLGAWGAEGAGTSA